jgi:hypothetical protein
MGTSRMAIRMVVVMFHLAILLGSRRLSWIAL